MEWTVRNADVPLGAEVIGLDLAKIDDRGFARLRAALDERAVLSIRSQRLTPRQLVEFTARLGPLQPYNPQGRYRVADAPDLVILSNIIENGVPVGATDAGNTWHADMCYTDHPPAYAALHALEIPRDAAGTALGATMMTSSAHAYNTLPQRLKDRVQGVQALHRRDKLQLSETRLQHPTDLDRDDLFAVHPVVRTHPVTGRKCLYVNQTYTVKLLGVDEAESTALLEQLCAHAIREDVRYVHTWAEGDVLLWDDCAIQHYAVPDYALPQRRLIYRATVDGGKPY